MDQSRWQQIGTIVDQALSLDTYDERTTLIKELCGNDEALKKEVMDWLDSIADSKGLWNELLLSNRVLMDDMTIGGSPALTYSPEELPEKIGLYKIKKQLGRGGMGDVYLAERFEGDFHEKVALKVIRNGVGSTEQVRRFLQERSLLSRLNHPNIARLLDGGGSGDGRPYYVMEFVDGIPITEYCSQHSCSLSERLDLFGQVCRAVQYAHTNFIVHRDLKPDNLLVTAEGTVKVLDFGIAKLLDQELSEQTLLQTRAGQRVLSLHYAAPEQITMEPVTAATDVYALGLLLYELLSRKRPFDLKGKKLGEAEHIIRNREPEYASKIADEGNEKLKGDLDAIIAKALRKEPEQRYESASRLWEDVERHRQSRPVQARKGTLRYRAGKFMQRKKTAIVAGVLFLIAAVGFGSYHIIQLNKERNIALLEAEKAQTVTDFLIGIFENADPWKQPQTDITAKEILDLSATYLQEEIKQHPETKAALMGAMGVIYESFAEYEKAESLLSEALTIEKRIAAQNEGNEFDLAVTLFRLGNLNNFKGNYEVAIEHFEQASPMFERLNKKEDYALNLLEWGWSEYVLGNYDRADSLYAPALRIYQNHSEGNTLEMAKALQHKGWLEFSLGNHERAEDTFSNALSIRRSFYEKDHPAIARTLHSLGWVNYTRQEYDKALVYNKEALAMRKRLFNNKPHPDIAWSMNNLGVVHQALGEYQEAEQLFNEALAMRKSVLPAGHQHISQSLGNLGTLYTLQKKYEKSAEIFSDVVKIQSELFGSDHPNVARYLNNLAVALNKSGKQQEALRYHQKAVHIQELNFEDWHTNTINFRDNMAGTYEGMKKFEQAEKLRLKNFEALKLHNGINHSQTQSVLKNMISLYDRWDKDDEKQAFQKLLAQSE